MDKRKRSHDLLAFKAAFARARAITMSAARSAVALGYGMDDVAAVVASSGGGWSCCRYCVLEAVVEEVMVVAS